MARRLATSAPTAPRAAAWELALLSAAVLLDLWLPAEHRAWIWLTRPLAITALIVSWRRRAARSADGLGAADLQDRVETAAPGRAWLAAAVATMAIAVVLEIWARGHRLPGESDLRWLSLPAPALAWWWTRRLLLATLQQGVLQLFLAPLFREALQRTPRLQPTSWAHGVLSAFAAALLFGAFHLPSARLALASSLAALVWIALYRRWRRLAPLIASHALLAGLATTLVPQHLFADLEVGRRAWDQRESHRFLGSSETRFLLTRLASPEYRTALGGDDESVVRGYYRDLLARVPEEHELADRVATLRGSSPVLLLQEMLRGNEIDRIRDSLPSRRHPVPSTAVLHVDDHLFLSGFSSAEKAFRWTDQRSARLSYPLNEVEPEALYRLELRAGAHGHQEVLVVIGGESVGAFELEGLEPQRVILELPSRLLRVGGNPVELSIPGASSTSDDPRLLGIALISVRLYPVTRAG